jgi:hypothetical protein
MLLCIVPIKPSAAALVRLVAPPLDHALQAAGNEAFSVVCRSSARASYAGLEAWRSNSYLGIGYRGVGYTETFRCKRGCQLSTADFPSH